MARNKTFNIGRFALRFAAGLLLTVYVVVALFNYSMVQSYLGAVVGGHLSKESGGVVKIGSMYLNPFSRMVLYDVLLITPTNDTVADAEKISCTFRGFPFGDHSLNLDRVLVKNTYYHLHVQEEGINLDYMIDAIARMFPAKEKTPHPDPFVVKVNHLHLSNVHYKQDLDRSGRQVVYEHGVQIPHMEYTGIKARFKDIEVVGGDVWCRIVSFAATEKSGFHLYDMSGDVEVSTERIRADNMELQADSTRLLFDALLEYGCWENMSQYCDSVYMDVTFKPESYTNMLVAAYWVPQWWGINIPVKLNGDIEGPVADLQVSNLSVEMGEATELLLDGTMTGLPYITQSYVDARVHRLFTNYNDVELLLASPITGIDELMPPAMKQSLQQLGNVSVSATVNGSFADCFATLGVASEMGNFSGDARIAREDDGYSYKANLNSSGVHVASVLPNDWVSYTGFDVAVKGRGFKMANMAAQVDANLFDTRLGSESINNTSLHAVVSDKVLTANINLSDTLVKLDVAASYDWNDSVDRYLFDVNLVDAKLHRLLPDVMNDSALVVSLRLNANLQGNDLENLNGSLTSDSGFVATKNGELDVNDVNLTLRSGNGLKSVALESPWFDMNVRGFFEYTDFPDMIKHFSQSYLPQYYTMQKVEDNATESWDAIADASVDASMLWKNSGDLLQVLMPALSVSEGTMLTVNHNFTEPMRVVMRSDSIKFGKVVLNNVGVRGGQQTSRYAVSVEMTDMAFNNTPIMKDLDVVLGTKPSESTVDLSWGGSADTAASNSHGDMALLMVSDSTGNYISITKTKFFIQGNRWDLMCTDNDVVLRDAYLSVSDLRLLSERQKLVANAKITKDDTNYIALKFERLTLDRFASLLLNESGFDINGALTGTVDIHDLNTIPYLEAELGVNSLVINDKYLGNLDIRSSWEAEQKQLTLFVDSKMFREAGSLRPIVAVGTVDMSEKDPALNLDAEIAHLSAEMFQPVLANVLSSLDGTIAGSAHIGGTFSKPDISATVKIDDGHLGLKPTGVTYSFTNEIAVNKSVVELDDFRLLDSDGNTAAVNGKIDLFASDNIFLDLALETDNVKVLDIQNSNNPYYGTLYAAISGSVTGESDNLVVSARIRANSGSEISVPLSDKRQVRSHEFITFVSDEEPVYYQPETSGENREPVFVKPKSLFSLTVDVQATPDLRLVFPMDFNQMYARIVATGNGDVQLQMNESGTPVVLGDYEISDGTLALKLPLFERDFTIESGSSIDFPGDLNNATFDIKALYLQRVNLSSLTGALSTESTRKNIQVQSVIALEGGLQTPSVKFDLRLPNADQSVEEEVFAYIDRSNERDMLNQTVSLLLFGQFYNSSTSAIEGILDNGLSSGYSLVANSVGNYVSKLVEFVDVNFDYKAATSLTTEQFDIDISKEWNKFYFESTFGYGGEAQALVEPDNSILMGDMLVGYKLGPLLHLYVFNRSNNNDYTRIDLPFKQGVGLKVSRDFNTWSELFRKKNKETANDTLNNNANE